MPRKIFRVAFLIESSRSFGRDVLQGALRYQRENGPWRIYYRQYGLGESQSKWLANWDGDGALVQVQNQRMAEAIIESGLVAVDLTYNVESYGLPRISLDNREFVRLAAEHLLERNFNNFAYIGTERGVSSRLDERCDLFVEFMCQAGHTCEVFPAKRVRSSVAGWEAEQKRISTWIDSLPKPIGIMACYDQRGHEVISACSLAGILVPDEVAVIAGGNDELICNLSDPPLSSIEPGAERLGYVAAALLDQLMKGEQAPKEPIVIRPLYVVTRRSTDALAVNDPDVVRAFRFIRDHACDGIKAEDVVRRVASMSRRVLDARCRELVGRTLHEEIGRVQIERAKQLLVETELTLAEIADRSGFEHTEYMTVVFKKKIGQPPSEYRQHSTGH